MKFLLWLIAASVIISGCASQAVIPTTVAFSTPEPTSTVLPEVLPTLTTTPMPLVTPSPVPSPIATWDASFIHSLPDCGVQKQFVYIGMDGNVYLYDLCSTKSRQLTFDGEPVDSYHRSDKGYYFVKDTAENYSGAGQLLVGKADDLYLLDTKTKQLTMVGRLGEYDQAALSPRGDKLALTDYSDYSHARIAIVDLRSQQEVTSFAGYAPTWVSDDEVFFLGPPGTSSYHVSFVHQALQVINLQSQQVITWSAGLDLPQNPAMISKLAADKNLVAVYHPAPEFASNIWLTSLDDNEPFNWKKHGGWDTSLRQAFAWSPKFPILAVCTAVGGSEAPDKFSGALVLYEWGKEPLAVPGCYSLSIPSWSPAGDRVAYLTTDNLMRIVSKEGESQAASNPLPAFIVYTTYGPMWSKDGSCIAVVIDNKVYVALANAKVLAFKYVTNGVDIIWHP